MEEKIYFDKEYRMEGNALQSAWASEDEKVIFQVLKEGPPERIELYIEVMAPPYSLVIREGLFNLRAGNEVGVDYKKYLFTQPQGRGEIIIQGDTIDIYKNEKKSHTTFRATRNQIESLITTLNSYVPIRGGKRRKTRRRTRQRR